MHALKKYTNTYKPGRVAVAVAAVLAGVGVVGLSLRAIALPGEASFVGDRPTLTDAMAPDLMPERVPDVPVAARVLSDSVTTAEPAESGVSNDADDFAAVVDPAIESMDLSQAIAAAVVVQAVAHEVAAKPVHRPPTTSVAAVSTPTPERAAPPQPTVTAEEQVEPSDDPWAPVRWCESRNRYSINTGNGFFGAYQFTIKTWNWVAGIIGRDDLVGVRPDLAAPADQDRLAQALAFEVAGGGLKHWPVCGKYYGS